MQPLAGQSFSSSILDIQISPSFFHPALGQHVAVSFQVSRAASLSVVITDAAESPVKKLVSVTAQPGLVSFKWDGRKENQEIAKEGVYLARIVVTYDGKSESHPSNGWERKKLLVPPPTYNRFNSFLSYKLPEPAEVSIAARCENEGSILTKTILHGSPRVAGSVIEVWNGFDESGRHYMPDLPGFRVGIQADSLPENAIIVLGNH